MTKKFKRLLITGVIVFCAFHLWNHVFSDHTSNHSQVTVGREVSEEKTAKKTKPYVYSWPKCQQNESAANISDFKTLPSHIKDFLYHRHCRHFPMLLDLPDKCGGANKSGEVFLLLVIKSSPANYDRREVLRKTWAKERLHKGVWIRRIFISGTADAGFEKETLNSLLQLEQQEFADILQWDFSDTFFNLTLKQILFLEWMERNCPNAQFLFNGDDDVFANTNNMIEYLQSLQGNGGRKHLFTGHLLKNGGPFRNLKSKYFIPVQVHKSNSYPPYCGGGGYLLSGYTALVIYNISKSITIFPIDDVYMGMCLAKAGLSPTSHWGFRTFGLYLPSKRMDHYDPCINKDFLLIHKFLPDRIYFMWHKLNDLDLKCSSRKTDR